MLIAHFFHGGMRFIIIAKTEGGIESTLFQN
jgi:hypothetical protein